MEKYKKDLEKGKFSSDILVKYNS